MRPAGVVSDEERSEEGVVVDQLVQQDRDGWASATGTRESDSGGGEQGSSYASVQARQRKQQKLREYDANTVVQTGAGVPGWTWRTVNLGWNGPVTRDQRMQLILVPPHLNLALAFIRVLFLTTLLLAVFGVFSRRRERVVVAGRAGSVIAALLIFGAGLLAPGTARADLPSAEILAELRARLIEPPECLPNCVTSPRMRIEATERGLRVVQELHVAAFVSVVLPGSAEQWLPTTVLVDGSPATAGLARTSAGTLLLELRPGRHEVVLEGPLPVRETVQIALGQKPHRVEAKAKGWTVDGIHEDGLADDNLQLTRVSSQEAKAGPPELEVGTLPAFVRLERSLQLGLTWDVTTRVARLTPKGAAVVLAVPLLPGESVTTADQRVEAGRVLVNMGPDQDEVTWTSVLPITPEIKLTAAAGEPWSEVWQVEVGPVWHVEHEGLPTVRQGEAGLREWRPWPGEQVTLAVTRPQGVPGQTLTIDSAMLHLEPGLRAVDARLELTVRSSRGGHHVIQIPEGALLQQVTIDMQRQMIGQEGRQVRVPVEPGLQKIELSWRESHELRQRFIGPLVDLGGPAVNVHVEMTFPQSRWILLVGGPRLGPAVLFWSYVIMLLLAAAVLSRLRWTPLRGHQWFLLGLGLSPIDVPLAMLVIGWFLAIAWRREHTAVPVWWYDLRQLLLISWTLVACICLMEAIHQGLLGQPDMQIEGNDSWGTTLRWYQDRVDYVAGIGGLVPRPWVLSVSMWWYRGLMLAWALWLAWLLVRWLPWAWHSFTLGGLWRPLTPPRVPPVSGPGASSTAQQPVAPATLTGGPSPHSSSASAAIFATSGQSMSSVEAAPPPSPSDTIPSARVGGLARPRSNAAARTISGTTGHSSLEIQETMDGSAGAPVRTRHTPPPVPSATNPPRRSAPRGTDVEELVPDDD